jgi:class 3 adenylate cyclase
MSYSGFPVAQEDAAHRALQAGLEILDAVRILGLGVRIGISTGQVVVRGASSSLLIESKPRPTRAL